MPLTRLLRRCKDIGEDQQGLKIMVARVGMFLGTSSEKGQIWDRSRGGGRGRGTIGHEELRCIGDGVLVKLSKSVKEVVISLP